MYESYIESYIQRIKKHFNEPRKIKEFLGKSLFLLPLALIVLLLKGNYHAIVNWIGNPFLTELYYALRSPLHEIIEALWILYQFAILLDALVLAIRFCFITVFAIIVRKDVISEFITPIIHKKVQTLSVITAQEYILFKQRMLS